MSTAKDSLPISGRLVSVGEAIRLGFGTLSSIYRYIHTGVYRSTKIAGRRMLYGDSLIEAAEAGETQPKDAA